MMTAEMTQELEGDRLYTLSEVAKLTGQKRATLYRVAQRIKSIPCHQTGYLTLYSKEKCLEILESIKPLGRPPLDMAARETSLSR